MVGTTRIRLSLISLFALSSGTTLASEDPPPPPAHIVGCPEPKASPDVQADAAWLLFLWQTADYTGLRTEFLRLRFEVEPSPAHPSLSYLGALSLARAGNWQQAESELRGLALTYYDCPIGWLAELSAAEIRSVEGAHLIAATQFEAFLTNHPQTEYHQLAAERAVYNLALAGHFSEAATLLDQSGAFSSPELSHLLHHPPPWRHPGLAALMSAALPGSGQFYAGYKGEAASAFVLNTLFISAMAWSIHHETWSTLALLTFFEVGWYAGNIYGAADAAIRHNRGIRDRVAAEIAAELEDFPLPTMQAVVE